MARFNPLENWRGTRSPAFVAYHLCLTQREYLVLESHPERSEVNSDQIIWISEVTHIPLPALVDWLTETTKESVSC